MSTQQISRLVGSSQYRAIADDSLKDEDNAAWVFQLEPSIQADWIERIGWIRLVDRLAEQDVIESGSDQFQQFYRNWKGLLETGSLLPGCTHYAVLSQMRDRWFTSPYDWRSIDAWDRYVEAIATYHEPNLVLGSLAQYEAMLENLAGAFFQVLPFLSAKHYEAAAYLGIVDQFYNNLRDLREDAEQGICYFPVEVLAEFGLRREDLIQMRCLKHSGYQRMMRFWLNDYLPKLRGRACSLLEAPDLHPSWQLLRDWSLRRYERIERVFRRCQFNYVLASQVYWHEVRRDLRLQTVCSPASQRSANKATTKPEATASSLTRISRIGMSLGLSPAAI